MPRSRRPQPSPLDSTSQNQAGPAPAFLFPMILNCRNRVLDLGTPRVMGVLNVTPDSFSDGGRYRQMDAALRHAVEMAEAGADIIDVGGESTRPGAQPVPEAEELERVLPVVERLVAELDVVISLDTMKPAVMQAAVHAGAHLVNDVRALQANGALQVVAEADVAVCLMHMQGEPGSMQHNPAYGDVEAEVSAFLLTRIEACREAGVRDDRIVIDPGFGFGKTLAHNLQLMRGLANLCAHGWPVLVGVSRKSMLGALLDVPAAERIHGGTAAAALAVWQGASIVRTHDVRATVEALKVVSAIKDMGDIPQIQG